MLFRSVPAAGGTGWQRVAWGLLTAVFTLALAVPAMAQQAAPAVTEFQYPLAVAARADGVVFVADRNLPGIWKVENGQKTIFFQGSKKFRTPLNAVRCLALDHQGRLLAGDSATREVYRFDDAGVPQPLTKGWIGIPMAMAVAADGTIYTADLELHRIWKMPAEGSEKPVEFAVINSPRGLALDADGTLWVLSTSSKDGQLQKVSADGKIEAVIKDHPFNLPHNLVRQADGTMYVTQAPNDIFALDAVTGEIKWMYSYSPSRESRPCCGRVNRGVAILGNTLYMATIDAHLIAEIGRAHV